MKLTHKFLIREGSAGEKFYLPPTHAFENRQVRPSLVLRAAAHVSLTLSLQASRDRAHWVEVRSWDAAPGCASFPVVFCEAPWLRVAVSTCGERTALGEISLTEVPAEPGRSAPSGGETHVA
ncbi:MAG: hypothetical protein FD180_3474 [Planctomycetota bacterium]|nr:MAG: hypothetical protein FD180_3474 [Planctomycetota bacterium]